MVPYVLLRPLHKKVEMGAWRGEGRGGENRCAAARHSYIQSETTEQAAGKSGPPGQLQEAFASRKMYWGQAAAAAASVHPQTQPLRQPPLQQPPPAHSPFGRAPPPPPRRRSSSSAHAFWPCASALMQLTANMPMSTTMTQPHTSETVSGSCAPAHALIGSGPERKCARP